jgi:hypothetical protein
MTLLLGGLIGGAIATVAAAPRASPSPQTGLCDSAAAQLVGRRAVSVGRNASVPRKARDVRPKYPTTCMVTHDVCGVGEALIDSKGDVRKVWGVREPTFDPPCPERGFSAAARGDLIAALRAE